MVCRLLRFSVSGAEGLGPRKQKKSESPGRKVQGLGFRV